jgi:diguanylate cyclase (GGDEF)-like protein/PAS domain S-box-containing protein
LAAPSLSRFVVRAFGKVPLQAVLIIPFVLQIMGTVGLVSYLSLKNGQQAVNDLAEQLMDEASARTQQHLKDYTALPQQIAQLVADDLELENIDLNPPDLQGLDRYFLKRIQTFKSVSFIYVGNEQGKFIGAGPTQQHGKSAQIVEVTDSTTQGNYVSYLVNPQGKRVQQLNTVPEYDPRRRPWYKAAIHAGRATWSEIYAFIGEANQGLTITAVQPFYQRSGQLAGVTAVDLYLNDISRFLEQLSISRSGEVFIVEPNGLLVASSSYEPIYTQDQNQLKRVHASSSRDPLIRDTVQQVQAKFGSLRQVQQSQRLKLTVQKQRQFVRVTPWRDQFGLNWLIVAVVPESDVMGRIYANTRTTSLLCLVALIVAVVSSFFTAQWVILPILSLNKTAKALAQGEWQNSIEINRSDAVGDLARSFNQMAQQLRLSFTEMQELNQALTASEQRLNQILEALPVGVCVLSVDGSYAYLNHRGEELLGTGVIPDVSLEQISAAYQVYLASTDQPYPLQQMPLIQALEGNAVSVCDMEIRRGQQIIPLEVRGIPVFNAQGEVLYAIATFQDISDRRRAEQFLAAYNQTLEQQVQERTLALQQEVAERTKAEAALHESRYFLQKIADTIPKILYLFDLVEGKVIYLNQQSSTLMGYSPEEIFQGGSQWLRDRFHPEDQYLCDQLPTRFATLSDTDVLSTEYQFQHKNGEWRWFNTRQVVFARDSSGNPIQILGSVEDITDDKQAEVALKRANLELESLAALDSLTQVANRRRFDGYLTQEWQRLMREQQSLGLLLCDIDYFKSYNDHYGHQAGDDCLVQVAQAMNRAIKRPADLVVRYGGEEFAVILPNTNMEGAIAVAETIRLAVQQLQLPHPQSQVSEYVTLSLGVTSVIPSLDRSPETLILAADRALYTAKRQGRNRFWVRSVS